MDAPAIEMLGVIRHYGALRPLRVASMIIAAGERVSIGGLDAGAAEVLVNLVTGAALPEAGEVRVFGRPTAAIASGDEWLDSLERFGIVSPRAVLLEAATLQQNLALPFTLDIDPIPPQVAARVRALALRCGIDADRWLPEPAGALPAAAKVRSHFARALALDPPIMIVEHPSAGVEPAAAALLAADMARAGESSRAAMLVLTNDDAFARLVASRNLTLHGATGTLKPLRQGWLTW